jgi:hypothetical protein
MYLEPIFASEDIKKKLPLEYRKFEEPDQTQSRSEGTRQNSSHAYQSRMSFSA